MTKVWHLLSWKMIVFLPWSLCISSDNVSIFSWTWSIFWFNLSYSGPLATAISWYISSSLRSCSWAEKSSWKNKEESHYGSVKNTYKISNLNNSCDDDQKNLHTSLNHGSVNAVRFTATWRKELVFWRQRKNTNRCIRILSYIFVLRLLPPTFSPWFEFASWVNEFSSNVKFVCWLDAWLYAFCWRWNKGCCWQTHCPRLRWYLPPPQTQSCFSFLWR